MSSNTRLALTFRNHRSLPTTLAPDVNKSHKHARTHTTTPLLLLLLPRFLPSNRNSRRSSANWNETRFARHLNPPWPACLDNIQNNIQSVPIHCSIHNFSRARVHFFGGLILGGGDDFVFGEKEGAMWGWTLKGWSILLSHKCFSTLHDGWLVGCW